MQDHMHEAEHHMFREAFREFLVREVIPFEDEWTEQGIAPRSVWKTAGENGFVGFSVPEEFGGQGVTDFRFNAIISEELAQANVSSLQFSLHTDIVVPYFVHLSTEEQSARWLPGFASGDSLAAIAMTEPGTGSDLQAVATTAIRQDDGGFLVNGSKTFISSGINGDKVIVVAKTDPSLGARGTSLVVVEEGMDGFERGRNLDKIGLKGQDTAELFFNDVVVPGKNLLGEEGMGFAHLMSELPQERLAIGLQSIAAAEAAFDVTNEYCKARTAFGKEIASFQNTRFRLAEMHTEITIGRTFVDQCILELNAGTLSTEKASMAKYWCSELQGRVVDQCLQLHGGYGFMGEYDISKMYVDARVSRIYGGTNEIMREIIGRSL
ncbi:MAG: acyl-CoA dehydrogenase [Acidimicrobiales bacterium]|nr:MAG: acyl-CoA dehydrogenase [Acidimicrobiales bacterium]